MYNKEICFDLLTNSLKQSFKKCMDASMENLYVDLGFKGLISMERQ